VLVTSHVMDVAEKCRRLGMLREGRLIPEGTLEELKAASGAASVEEAFLHYGGVRA